jgi:galactose mutarotase-like enzyme
MAPSASLIRIGSDFLQAEISPLGAQLFTLRNAKGRDLQWGGDPAVWKGRAPVLFPIVGELNAGCYRLEGKTYRLSRHGFARDRSFSLVKATPTRAVFRLEWDSETFEKYPFHFQLWMEFSIKEACLKMVASIKNLESERVLPASFGFHPALAWPLPFGQPREEHAITFDVDENAPIRRLDAQGMVQPATFPTPVTGRTLKLRDDLFLQDAIIFDRIRSHRLAYGAEEGPRIEIEFPDTPCLGIWTKPGANFICIEPWHGIADPEGFSGDIYRKPGMILVPPGQAATCAMKIAITRD